MEHKGRVTEWNRDRAFGYLECEGSRIFLHWRDFSERHKVPEPGDLVFFTVGHDRKGRICATAARHVADGGRFEPLHMAQLILLLALPLTTAFVTLGRKGGAYAVGWYGIVSVFTYLIYAYDKRMAREKGWREKESQLHFFELIGGWPGAFVAQRRLRHKTTKWSFQFIYVLIVGLHQVVAIEALRGWPWLRHMLGGAEQ